MTIVTVRLLPIVLAYVIWSLLDLPFAWARSDVTTKVLRRRSAWARTSSPADSFAYCARSFDEGRAVVCATQTRPGLSTHDVAFGAQ